MRNGDHACLLYSSERARLEAVRRYVGAGLSAGERVFYVAEDDERRDALVGLLSASGTEFAHALEDGSLVMRSVAEGHLAGGGDFDAERMILLLQEDISVAAAEGYSACRFAGEMEWVLTSQTDTEALIDYEIRVDRLLRETGAVGLCQYDHERFDRTTARKSEWMHQLVLAERDSQGRARCQLLVERGPDGETVVRGEADGPSCESLARSLEATIARSDHIRLDLSDLSFISAAGMRTIHAAAQTVDSRGGRLTLVSPRPVVRQVVELMGFGGSLTIEAA